MTARQLWISIAVAGALHNGFRVVAKTLGAQWDFLNYLRPFDPVFTPEAIAFAAVPLVFLGFVVWVAVKEWNKADGDRGNPFLESAAWAIPTSLASGGLALLCAIKGEGFYGWLTFVFVPVIVGFQSAFVLSRRKPSATLGQAIGIAIVSIICMGGLAIAIAVEGLICVAMAAPLAIPLAALGGALGYLATKETKVQSSTAFLLLVGLTPFGATIEHAIAPQADTFEITTSVDLAAPPERVWRAIVEPGKPEAPSNWLFRAGVGYPLSNHLEGTGPTATRYCDFSTGKLVEPVILWDENRELRFRVAVNPPPMRELSPYRDLHPPHLDGFLVARQGRFKLTPLANGGTLLEATSWYQHHLWPSRYWRLWSDYLIHSIHQMVLSDIRSRVALVR